MNVTGTIEIEVKSVDEWHKAFDYADGLGLRLHSTGVYGVWWGASHRVDLTHKSVNVADVEGFGPNDYFEFEIDGETGRYEPFVGEHETNGSIILEFVGTA